MDVTNMLSNRAHLKSLLIVWRQEKKGNRMMGEWEEKYEEASICERLSNRRNGVTLNRMTIDTLNLSLRSCVLRGFNQALLAAIVIVPLGAALRLYKEGTCPGSSMLSIEKFSNGVLSAAGCFCNRGLRKARFPPEPTHSEKNSYL